MFVQKIFIKLAFVQKEVKRCESEVEFTKYCKKILRNIREKFTYFRNKNFAILVGKN